MAAEPSSSTTNTVVNPLKRKKNGDVEADFLDECLSADTLDAIGKNRPSKRSSTAVDRSEYPKEGKAIYLNTKKLLNKKVAIAAHLKVTKGKLESGKFPNFVNFKATPFGGAGDLDYITSWSDIVVKAKRDLTLLYCDKLAATYRDTKNLIDLNMAELQNILSDEQFDEVFKYLKSGYKIAGKRAASKALVPFKERPKNFPRRKQPSGNQPPRRIASQKTQAR
jgi:hypothetical protein